MRLNVLSHWIVRVVLVAGAASLTVGCPEDAIDITEQASVPSFDFPVAGSFAAPVGPFAIDRTSVAFDTTVSDAFNRAASTFTDSASFFTCGGACPAWEFPIANGSQDARLPLLQDADAGGSTAITRDDLFGSPFLIFTISGLEPSTEYTFALERLALTINEGLDVVNLLLGNPAFGTGQTSPDAADELSRLGGTAGTTLGSNYYEIARITTDVDGNTGFNALAFDGGGTNDIIETNALQPFDLPQYNYLVVYKGPPSDGIPVMRAQVGVDLNPSGDPINNALAPWPLQALALPQVQVTDGFRGAKVDSLTVTFNGLEALTGGWVYAAWLVNPLTGGVIPAQGTYSRIKIIAERDPITGQIVSTRDSLVEATGGVGSFVGGDEEDGFRHQLVLSDANLPGGVQDSIFLYTHVVLSLESSAGGSEPAGPTAFWFSYNDQRGTPGDLTDDSPNASGLTSFGTFEIGDAGAELPYGGDGGGTGGFRGDVLSVDLESISRPPAGYAYVGWLVREDGTAFRLPDITGPPPDRVSLVDADVEDIPGLTTPTGIVAANVRVEATEGAIDFTEFRTFLLSLEPKVGDPGLGSIPTHVGLVPERVFSPPEE